MFSFNSFVTFLVNVKKKFEKEYSLKIEDFAMTKKKNLLNWLPTISIT